MRITGAFTEAERAEGAMSAVVKRSKPKSFPDYRRRWMVLGPNNDPEKNF